MFGSHLCGSRAGGQSADRLEAGPARGDVSRGTMRVVKRVFAGLAVTLVMSSAQPGMALADDGFPFGMEMTLDALPQPGSKRVPDLDIGYNGDTVLELWCKGGKGQFS